MARPKLVLYVDILSPFAYLAFYLVRTSPVFQPCEVTYVPVLLGGILKACGNTAPIFIKNKERWINLERERWSGYFNIPIADQMPAGFPVQTLTVQRALAVTSVIAPEKLAHTIAALYEDFFVKLKPINKLEDFVPTLKTILGDETTKDVVDKIGTVGKEVLTANTEKAVAAGAFGLPFYEATNTDGKTELYWGFDHIGQVVDHLSLKKPEPGTPSEAGWKAVL